MRKPRVLLAGLILVLGTGAIPASTVIKRHGFVSGGADAEGRS